MSELSILTNFSSLVKYIWCGYPAFHLSLAFQQGLQYPGCRPEANIIRHAYDPYSCPCLQCAPTWPTINLIQRCQHHFMAMECGLSSYKLSFVKYAVGCLCILLTLPYLVILLRILPICNFTNDFWLAERRSGCGARRHLLPVVPEGPPICKLRFRSHLTIYR